jgi:hypothetical protein
MARAAGDLAAEAAAAAVRRKEMRWLWREGGREEPPDAKPPTLGASGSGGRGRGVRGSEGEEEVRRRGSGRREEADGRGGSGIGFGDLLYEANAILAVRSQMNGLK